MRTLPLLLALTLLGCPSATPTSPEADADTDTDTDSDTDSDTDADSDADTDADTDVDTGFDSEETVCDDLVDDDGDGWVDCEDHDCQLVDPACAGVCPAEDAFEENDSLVGAFATGGTLGETGLMVHSQDPDFYAVDVPANGIVRALAQFVDNDGDIDMRLFDGAGTQVDTSTSVGDEEEVSFTNGATAQTYTIEVYQYGFNANNCSNYDLSVYGGAVPTTEVCGDLFDNEGDGYADCADLECASDPVCACPAEDSFEPNDTLSTAIAAPTATGLRTHPQAPDFFNVTVPPGELLNLEALASANPVQLRLTDAAGGLLEVDDSLIQRLNTSDSAEDWVVEVRADVCAGYDLTSSVGPPPPEDCTDGVDNDFDGRADCLDYACIEDVACPTCGPDDTLEPNDTLLTASDVVSEIGLQVHVQNRDLYRYDVPPGELLDVTVNFVSADGNINLRLLDENGDVLQVEASGTDDERLQVINTTDETQAWFVEVSLANLASPCNTYGIDGFVGPVPDEQCTDGGDDDLDGLIDCADYDCMNDVACQTDCAPEDPNEPNDVLGEAVFIGPSENLAAHRQNDDWFLIDAEPDDVVRATMQFVATSPRRMSMRLFNGDGGQVGAVSSTNGLATVFDVNDDTAETYALEVKVTNTQGDPCAAYDLQFTSEPVPDEECTGGIDDDLDNVIDCLDLDCAGDSECVGVCEAEDPFEPNDSLEDAQYGLSGFGGLLAHRQSEDWFALETDAGDLVNAEILFSDAAGNLDLRLYDADGVVLATSASASDNEQIQWLNEGQDQIVYARVNVGTVADTCNTFDLVLEAAPPPPEICDDLIDNDFDGRDDCDDYDCIGALACVNACPGSEDTFEENDFLEDAAFALGQQTDLLVHAQDPDWFVLFATEGDILDVQLDHDLTTGARLGVWIYDSEGVLVQSNQQVTGSKRIAFVVEETEDYFVRVDTLNGNCNTYDLYADSSPSPPEVCDDTFDNDLDGFTDCDDYACLGSAACAGVCASEDLYGGTNHSFGDALELDSEIDLLTHIERSDFIRVPVADNTIADVTVSFVDLDGDIDLTVYNESGFAVATVDSFNDDEEITITNDGGIDREYVVEVRMDGDTCNTYDLEVITTPMVAENCANAFDDDGDGWYGCEDLDCALDPAQNCGCVEDVLEPNDHPGLAFFGQTSVVGATVLHQSQDFWSYTVAPGETIDVLVGHLYAGGDIDAALLDETGVQLRGGTSSTDDESFTWTNTGTDPTDVYLQVYLWNGTNVPCNSYDLTVSIL